MSDEYAVRGSWELLALTLDALIEAVDRHLQSKAADGELQLAALQARQILQEETT